MPRIYLKRDFKEIDIDAERDLRRNLMDHEVELYSGLHKYLNCRGRGLCGTCLVRVDNQDVLSERTPPEKAKIPATDDKVRLACQVHVYAKCSVQTFPRVRQGWMDHKVYQHLIEE